MLTLYGMAVGFSTYFCMYAFRRPFAAAEYLNLTFLGSGVALKTALVISQVIGYNLSKYLGIKVCSEVTRDHRPILLVILIVLAHAALLLFAVVPNDWKVVALFLNGLPLGMVWGLVVWYLEGRRTSELLLAALSCSFIISSGVVKDVGLLFMGQGVSESWMPFVTGLTFLPLFLLSVWLLNQMPEPTPEDLAARSERRPMDGSKRWTFVTRYLPGLLPLLVVYFFLTAFRDIRDNFGRELFKLLKLGDKPGNFSQTEILVGLAVMVAMALLNLIKSNRWGLAGGYFMMTGGLMLVGVATLLLDFELIGGLVWMILIGLGIYLAYVPHNSMLFDRMLATTRFIGTSVFAIYLADALGYTGSVVVQLYKDLGPGVGSLLDFMKLFSYLLAVVGAVLMLASCAYFMRQKPLSEDNRERDGVAASGPAVP
jgi:MFS family permease